MGGGYPKDDIRWQRGGEGVWEGPKKDDVIYEQPLSDEEITHQGADILILSRLIGIKFDRKWPDLPPARDLEYFIRKYVK